jgi:cytokinin riboside 5'-monophosphate phosphoribohydrolase
MRIAVYCSSSSAVAPVYVQAARELGHDLAARGHDLVYGGCDMGLMGELARAAKAGGGHILGVLPESMNRDGLVSTVADEMVITATMAERKARMERHAEAFVTLPGGFGTLEETLQALTLKQLGYHQVPIVLLNTACEGQGFYAPLLTFFESLYTQRFAKPDYRRLYHVAATPAEALDYIESYRAVGLPSKWYGDHQDLVR